MALRGRMAASLITCRALASNSFTANKGRGWGKQGVVVYICMSWEDEEVESGLCSKFNLGCIARLSGGEEEATWTKDS